MPSKKHDPALPKTPKTKDITNREYFSADTNDQAPPSFSDDDDDDDDQEFCVPEDTLSSKKQDDVRTRSTDSLVEIIRKSEGSKEELEMETGKGKESSSPSSTASDVLLRADLRDFWALSEADRRARAEGKSEAERKEIMLQMQKERVEGREEEERSREV